ncbi:MAG: DUF111 family protein [Candidatus Thermoplasmatota archaeon]|nr:DUF111 family protein [Candidatus Thermoplasmatota archaeon]
MNVTLDLRCGISGDMLLGAMLHWYSKSSDITDVLTSIEEASSAISPTKVSFGTVERHGIASGRLEVKWRSDHDHIKADRLMGHLRRSFEDSGIGRTGREISEKILRRMLEAESIVHVVRDPMDVHLHETGTPDTIVDVLGIGMMYELLELDSCWVQATPISLGYGEVDTSHGKLKVPVPAVRAMIRDVPVRGGPVSGELATPTGVAAALVMTEIWLDQETGGDMSEIHGERVGSGAGKREYAPPFRNALNIYLEDPR